MISVDSVAPVIGPMMHLKYFFYMAVSEEEWQFDRTLIQQDRQMTIGKPAIVFQKIL
jgi:hypothetical protein